MKKETKIAHLKMSIAATEGKIKQYTESRKKLIDQLIEICDHPKEECVEYHKRDDGGECYGPPVRVCKKCGHAEEGWSFLFGKLHFNYEPITNTGKFGDHWQYLKRIMYQDMGDGKGRIISYH